MTGDRWIRVTHVIMAVVLAIALVVVGAHAAERYRLPFLHSWALVHGTIAVVFPIYFLVCYLLLHPVARRLATRYAPNSAIRDQRVSKLAVWSLLLSGSGFLIPLLGSGLGVAFGHMARRHCKEQPKLYGSGIALAGLIVGYAGLAMVAYMVVVLAWGYLSGQFA